MEREQIFGKLRERIVAFAASRIARDAAEDVAQEVLMLLHEKYAGVTRLDELVPLSFRILRFKMWGQLRKAHRRGEDSAVSVDDIQLPGEEPDPSVQAERRQALDRLAAALERMEPRCKDLFRLKLEGRTFPEIQAVMGVRSINTIYTWDFRCRKRLLEEMGGGWEPGG